jgi:hypothetical protein
MGTDLGDGIALDLLAHLANLAHRPAILVIGEHGEADRYMQAGADRFIVLASTFDNLSDGVIALARECGRAVT